MFADLVSLTIGCGGILSQFVFFMLPHGTFHWPSRPSAHPYRHRRQYQQNTASITDSVMNVCQPCGIPASKYRQSVLVPALVHVRKH